MLAWACAIQTNQFVSDNISWLAPQSWASKFVLNLTYISRCHDTALNEFFVQITAHFNLQVEWQTLTAMFAVNIWFNFCSFYYYDSIHYHFTQKFKIALHIGIIHDNQTEKLHGIMVYWDNSSTDYKVWYIDDWIYYNSFLIQCNAFNLIKYTDGSTGLSACCCKGKSHFAKFCLILNSAPLLSTTQS